MSLSPHYILRLGLSYLSQYQKIQHTQVFKRTGFFLFLSFAANYNSIVGVGSTVLSKFVHANPELI